MDNRALQKRQMVNSLKGQGEVKAMIGNQVALDKTTAAKGISAKIKDFGTT